MTPKEKAEDLVEKYRDISISFVDSIEGTCDMYINNEDAKECALIAVDEILTYQEQLLHNYKVKLENSYWYKVQQEIEKL